jgi:Pvc16 N-terminal domain
MSNHLAIATVTATLGRVVQAGIQSISGAAPTITTLQPIPGSGTPDVGINIFLYQVTPNSAVNNSDLNLRRPKGDLIRRAQMGLDLHYLLTFYGDEKRLEAQILMGSAVKTLVDNPFLTSSMFRKTLADPNFSYLAESTLPEQTERVRLTPLSLKPDDMARIWNTMPQANAMLSIAYEATFVLIEGDDMGDAPMPIRDRRTYVGQGQPIVERVTHMGRSQRTPVTMGSILSIIGKNFKGQDTRIKIGGTTIRPPNISDTQINLNLSAFNAAGLKAGVQSLQIIHFPPENRQIETHRRQEPDFSIESNAIAFVLCPKIVGEAQLSGWEQSEPLPGEQRLQASDIDPRQGDITIELDIQVEPSQRVLLIMNRVIVTGEPANLVSSIFQAKVHDIPTQTVTFPCTNLQPGEYLFRVQVDGAESEFSIDTNVQSSTFDQYIGPKIFIS